MEVFELLKTRHTQQAVTATQVVIEEAEGPPLRKSDEPERELGELHGHRVDVYAVNASFRDQSARQVEPFLKILRHEVVSGRLLEDLSIRRDACTATLGFIPRLHQSLAQPATDLDQKRRRPHSHVADLEVEELHWSTQLPLVTRFAFGWADVNEGLEGLSHDLFSEGL